MQIALRPARAEDFDFCAEIYFAEMRTILEELNLDLERHAAGFRDQWQEAQVQTITVEGSDVGWLQSVIREETLFLAQILIERSFQRRGIGAEVINQLILAASNYAVRGKKQSSVSALYATTIPCHPCG